MLPIFRPAGHEDCGRRQGTNISFFCQSYKYQLKIAHILFNPASPLALA